MSGSALHNATAENACMHGDATERQHFQQAAQNLLHVARTLFLSMTAATLIVYGKPELILAKTAERQDASSGYWP